MTFKLTCLGVSSALPTISKHQSAHLLNIREQYYLLDAGEGVQSMLKRCDVNLMKLNHIFITHIHGDHVFGLFGLLSTMGMLGRERALDIYAPKPMKMVIENHCKIFDKGIVYPINIHEVNTKESQLVYENKVITVHTVPLKHSVPTVGYVFREKEPELNIHPFAIDFYNLSIAERVRAKRGEDIQREGGVVIKNSDICYKPYSPRSFAYCSDTAYYKQIIQHIKGVNLLLMESTFLSDETLRAKKTGHSTAQQTAQLAAEANVGKLLLTHFSTRYKIDKSEPHPFLVEAQAEFENTEIATELMSYDIK